MCAIVEVVGYSKHNVAALVAAILQLQFRIALVEVSVLRTPCTGRAYLNQGGIK